MVHTDKIEGKVGSALWFHYDADGDVLYLRRMEHRRTPTVGEMTTGGAILLRDEATDEVVGVTIVDWWRTHGEGDTWGTREAFERTLERTVKRVPLAA